MIAAVLAGLTILGQVLSFVNRLMDAMGEKNEAIKKEKTAALQHGVRSLVDKDTSRLSVSIIEHNRLRK